MKILVINSGSSSIKFKLFELQESLLLASGIIERIGENKSAVHIDCGDAAKEQVEHTLRISDHDTGFRLMEKYLRDLNIVDDFNTLDGIGHRVVHGGELFHSPTVIDQKVIAEIQTLVPLAPLHNPANLAGIRVAMKLAPDVIQVAVFDTAFHQSMPKEAYMYALKYDLYEKEHIRRYGFHGTSHSYAAKAAASFLNRPLESINLITLHLGNGASATAVRKGRSMDTSMGMTPLEGLMMGSRCGDIDPAIVLYLLNNTKMSTAEIDSLLNRQSGLEGICGVNDMREVLLLIEKGDQKARLAVEMFTYRLKKYIGAYAAVLGRTDAIVFTGGIGEHAAVIREQACQGLLETIGVEIDIEKNAHVTNGICEINSNRSRIKALVVPADEECEIAAQVQKML